MPDDNPDDNELMRRLAQGEEAALRTLIDRWQAPLLGFTYRYLQDRDAAHDVTQETFVRLFHARDRYKLDARFTSWLFKIAANLCRNHQRWLRRHPSEPFGLDAAGEEHERLPEPLWETAHPARLAESGDTAAALAAAVQTLPHAQKVTVLLHYYEDLSYREIARVLRCTERGVETRLYRARKSLAEIWRQRAAAPRGNESTLPPTVSSSIRL